MQNIKTNVPWWLRISSKLVLSRLPIAYGLWERLALFKHGEMDDPSYAYRIFTQYFERFKQHYQRQADFLHQPQQDSPKEFVTLEMGPGDSLASGMISWAFGGSASYLVDVGDFASKNIETYRVMADFLVQKGLPVPDIHNFKSIEELLDCCSITYLTSGLSSLRTIPDRSVDFIWSHGVLGLVRKAEFLDTLRELRRIIRDTGVCSHKIGFTDAYYELNSLRFPEPIWESDFMALSGFYTNRIKYSQMLELFRQANFEVEVLEIDRLPELPISRSKISKEFQHISDEELCISSVSVLLKPI